MPGQDRAGIQSKAERMSVWRWAGLVRVGAREEFRHYAGLHGVEATVQVYTVQ